MDFSKIDLNDNQKLARIIIFQASNQNFKDRRSFERFRNSLVKKYKGRIFHNLYFVKAYNDLLKEGKIKENQSLLNFIQKRGVRTLSGVAPVTVLTKPFPCPGRCIYCPSDVRMPKSYLPSQPAAQRAFRQGFNPYTQVFVRLKALQMTGHEISKVELRIIGGTFSSYPRQYRTWFIKRCLQAMNEFHDHMKKRNSLNMSSITHLRKVKSSYGVDKVNTVYIRSLADNQVSFESSVCENEYGKIKCIGINIETRPDFINKREIEYLRKLGVTKVEMGVQTTYDSVQAITGRGHDLKCVRKATKLLKDSGFKIGYHIMPNLPGTTVEMDKNLVFDLFKDDKYQPDYLKLYPCVVIPGTKLAKQFKLNKYCPYNDDVLQKVLEKQLSSVPYWCRVDRVARDIPSDEIESGFKVSNVRQIIEKNLVKKNIPPREIRFREIKNNKFDINNISFVIRKYEANGGEELFLSYEDIRQDKLIALLRLRFPAKTFIKVLKNNALVREVHVYGRQIAVGKRVRDGKQHFGWGTLLLEKAEKLVKERGIPCLAIIAGIGTRQYYQKKGYNLKGTYMVKNLF